MKRRNPTDLSVVPLPMRPEVMRGSVVIAIALSMVVGLTAAGATRADSPEVGDITIVITNLRSTDGEVLISLYDRAEGFPKDRNAIVRGAAIPADGSGQVTTVFEDLPLGDYAVAVLHDEDNSRDMTFGRFRLPKEGYCFSNNVKVRFKAPKFEKTKFTLDGDGVTQTLRMRY
jgi:uncharacterized protein (DUF2141 family)